MPPGGAPTPAGAALWSTPQAEHAKVIRVTRTLGTTCHIVEPHRQPTVLCSHIVRTDFPTGRLYPLPAAPVDYNHTLNASAFPWTKSTCARKFDLKCQCLNELQIPWTFMKLCTNESLRTSAKPGVTWAAAALQIVHHSAYSDNRVCANCVCEYVCLCLCANRVNCANC